MRLVMKFGGTSVSGGQRIQNVADLVYAYAQQGHTIVTVTSAMSGVTDTLIRAARHAAAGDDAVYLAAHESLTEEHFAALDHIVRDEATREIARNLACEFGLIIVASIPPINDPMSMLSRASLLNQVGQVPVLVISEQPSRPESDARITYLNFPFDMDDLTQTAMEIINRRPQNIEGQEIMLCPKS